MESLSQKALVEVTSGDRVKIKSQISKLVCEILRLTLTPVNSLHTHTKTGDRPDTISTLVNRLFITTG